MVGVNEIDRIVEVLEETLKGNTVRMLGRGGRRKTPGTVLSMPKIRKNPLIEIIPISNGYFLSFRNESLYSDSSPYPPGALNS